MFLNDREGYVGLAMRMRGDFECSPVELRERANDLLNDEGFADFACVSTDDNDRHVAILSTCA